MKPSVKIEKGCVCLEVNPKVYTLATVYSAGYVFLDRAYIYLDERSGGVVEVWLTPKDTHEDLRKLGLEFYNELLNYAHYFTSLKANAESLKILMQRALFSASPSLVKDAEEQEVEDLIKELEQEESVPAKKKRKK